ncbi:short chain dehydrogenase [Bradyrhizobium oligotrophicum S58]|uniref:Short chain dehydrogenase n=1 Tax=Bradyrhizobium oligotrophicum S58 TaxID=1245469 RepID=M4Z9M3_9BRAD|nr:SDR family oxidoreductase [Bradyrhizobium oligotrophicum]BAM90419.1 short chain dehydrogenase [Bradyrhizobium oligotrophicum S58]
MARSIIVTGASKGIGRAAAEALSANGWHVIGIARSAPAAFPGTFIEVDLADAAATSALVESVAARGDVLGIVNNAGMARAERFGDVDPTAFLSLLAFNLQPALRLTQALLPAMRAARFGRIVNVTSLVTLGLPQRTSYAASKAALESITRTIGIEQAPHGITANAVAPGPTETELFRSNNAPGSEGEARYLAQVPMNRLGAPAEIAAAIAFLASDAAGFITGQTLFVDGGASLGRG